MTQNAVAAFVDAKAAFLKPFEDIVSSETMRGEINEVEYKEMRNWWFDQEDLEIFSLPTRDKVLRPGDVVLFIRRSGRCRGTYGKPIALDYRGGRLLSDQ